MSRRNLGSMVRVLQAKLRIIENHKKKPTASSTGR